ncbi:terminase [Mesorhizobium abyssinicae]|uniref:Terminase n=1 Tax=Mesorhizobium abyssinicae TaxID=1209958 RepID=A0ABU5AIF3_9HYPH|nr:terminase [Mesorhizobium abyssinicae]MDX8537053.1 terminase [Mesorhizobium abyssinicae]
MNARVDPNDAIIELAASCRFKPKRWSRVAWDWGVGALEKHPGPREWQDDINGVIEAHLANPATRYQPLQIAVASGHGIGKSAEMAMLSNWAMSCFDDAKIVTTANTEGQLRTKTAPEIGKWFRSSITGHWFDTQTMSIKSRDRLHADSWRQDFIPWSEHNTEAFAGLHNEGKIILLLFDEASKIHDKVWEVAEGALTDENTVIIWIVFGNPTRNSGRFRECFRRFRHRWVQRQIDSRTVPGTNKAYLQRLVDDHGEDSDIVKVRVRGQFPAQSAMQFISEADADKARKVHLRKEQYSFAPVILGVDPAWTGDDKLEIMLRQGLYSKSLATIERNDNDVEVANLIARLEDEHQADAVFVDAGYGTGIVSAGQVMGRSWRLIWFSGKSVDEGYLNQRAYMWGQKKKWLKQGGAIDPADEGLYQDIVGPETVARLDGKIQLESKEDMKERGLPSPNKGDALALTFAEPVAKKDRNAGNVHGGAGRGNMAETEYDPLKG